MDTTNEATSLVMIDQKICSNINNTGDTTDAESLIYEAKKTRYPKVNNITSNNKKDEVKLAPVLLLTIVIYALIIYSIYLKR